MNCAPASARSATRPSLSHSFNEKGRNRALACSIAGEIASVAERGVIGCALSVRQLGVGQRELCKAREPCVPGFEGAVALDAVAFFFVADLFAEVFFERREEVEGDVGGLEVLCFGVGDVVGEAAVGAEAGGGCGLRRRWRWRRRSVPASRPEAMDSV